MKAFSKMLSLVSRMSDSGEKRSAVMDYFRKAESPEAAWAVWLLSGNKIKKWTTLRVLQQWCLDTTQLPNWLFEESYNLAGDLAETIALIVGQTGATDTMKLKMLMEEILIPFSQADEIVKKDIIIKTWKSLDTDSVYVLNKLLTGTFKTKISQSMLCKALAEVGGLQESVVMHRLSHVFTPTEESYNALISPITQENESSRPFPFYQGFPMDPAIQTTDIQEWQAEWMWNGFRAQLIHHAGEVFIWSEEEGLMVDRFPEIEQSAQILSEDGIMDGVILAWKDGKPLPLSALQKRISSASVSNKLLKEFPVVFIAFDILSVAGSDCRSQPLFWRRQYLNQILGLSGPDILVSPVLESSDWQQLELLKEQAHEHCANGIVLKRKDSPYLEWKQKGDWWEWKKNPYTVTAVLLYAAKPRGKHYANFTELTFGLWNDLELVSFAKATSTLNHVENAYVNNFVRRYTVEKTGPVYTVEPKLIFEIAFDDLQPSSRHKIGMAVIRPRIVRLRNDLDIYHADEIERLIHILKRK